MLTIYWDLLEKKYEQLGKEIKGRWTFLFYPGFAIRWDSHLSQELNNRLETLLFINISTVRRSQSYNDCKTPLKSPIPTTDVASPPLLPTNTEGQKRRGKKKNSLCPSHYVFTVSRAGFKLVLAEACLSWELLLSSMLLPTEKLHSLAASKRQLRNGAAKC